jgi:hypothetical protein
LSLAQADEAASLLDAYLGTPDGKRAGKIAA